MNYNQLTELRDLFKSTLVDWDVPIEVNTTEGDETATVSFNLWGIELEFELVIERGTWRNYDDACQWPAQTEVDVWRLIASKLFDQIPRK